MNRVMMSVKRIPVFIPLLLFILTVGCAPKTAPVQCKESYGTAKEKLVLATGSPGELGLVKVLAEAFNAASPCTLCWVKAGSGESLKLLKEKKVDMIMVHAPKAEKQAVDEGWAVKRTLIGSNEFYIVGPANDPAKIAGSKNAAEAYGKIAKAKARFYSRGDNSGTHKKEMAIWKKANITPAGAWYIVTKEFMMATLKKADAEKGYFMTDSSTWVAAKKEMKNLKVLYKGDPFIVNTYHALGQPKGATPGQDLADKFIAFLASEQGQKIFGGYGKDKHGEALYNDAAYAKKYIKE